MLDNALSFPDKYGFMGLNSTGENENEVSLGGRAGGGRSGASGPVVVAAAIAMTAAMEDNGEYLGSSIGRLSMTHKQTPLERLGAIRGSQEGRSQPLLDAFATGNDSV
jgi:hypothetical protein